MKVHDFAKRLGLPDSNIRYYDRMGLIQSGRQKENNYRSFTEQDALAIYHAKMLRSFDMSVQEALAAKDQELSTIDGWVTAHIQELERQLAWEEMRMSRLREMRRYFAMIQFRKDSLGEDERDDSFNVWNFGPGTELSDEEARTIQLLSEYMPFSYVAIRISRESILRPGEGLDVNIGLGILRRNLERVGLSLPPTVPFTPGSPLLDIFLEVPDPFAITKRDISPLLKELESRGIPLTQDLIGRIFFSYVQRGTFVHGVSLGYPLNG